MRQRSSNSSSIKGKRGRIPVKTCSTDSIEERFCDCGVRARMWTSWTEEHPGMRFFGCPNWKDDSKRCHFFAWYDPPMTQRARELLNDFKNTEVEVKTMSSKLASKKLKISNLKDEVWRLKEENAILNTKLAANGWKEKMIMLFIVIVSGLLVLKNAKMTPQLMLG